MPAKKKPKKKKAPSKCDCPRLKNSNWDLKTHNWKNKKFLYLGLPMVAHVPVGFSGTLHRLMNMIKERGYKAADEFMILEEDGLFHGKLMIAIKLPGSPDKHVISLSGKVVSKVHDGPYNKLFKSTKVLTDHLSKKGLKPKKIYFWYVTCPKCWEEKGMKTVIFAQV